MRFITTIHYLNPELQILRFQGIKPTDYTNSEEFTDSFSFTHTTLDEGFVENLWILSNDRMHPVDFIEQYGVDWMDNKCVQYPGEDMYKTFPHRIMAVGDIIVTWEVDSNRTVAYLCESIGWTRIDNKESN